MDLVELEYPPTGGRNAFPQAAVAAWMARGWVEPAPDDVTADEPATTASTEESDNDG